MIVLYVGKQTGIIKIKKMIKRVTLDRKRQSMNSGQMFCGYLGNLCSTSGYNNIFVTCDPIKGCAEVVKKT